MFLRDLKLEAIDLKNLDFLHISGPTASGKTDLAHFFYLSEKFSRIINADSRQFYQDLNIGTAKPSEKQQKKFNYCLIDFLKIGDPFSSHLFHEKLKSFATKKEKTPKKDFSVDLEEKPLSKPSLIVGGPSLYTQGLFSELPKIASSKIIREKIEKQYLENGLKSLLDDISKKDPNYFLQMDRDNPRRAIRALEVMEITEKPYSLVRKMAKTTPYRVTTIYLLRSRKELVEKIEKRTIEMLENGWLAEGEYLLEKYPPQILEKINAVGYKHLFAKLKGDISKEELVEKITTETWQLAKRQMTWIKKQIRQKEDQSKRKMIVFSKEIAKLLEKNEASAESCFFDQGELQEIQKTIPMFSEHIQYSKDFF